MDFDETLELIKEHLQKDKGKILNPIRYADIIESYKTLKIIFNNDCNETTLEILDCALQTGDIAIEITTPMLSAYNMTLLTKAFQKADIVNIYPTIDDRIRLTVQFHNGYFVTTM